MTTHGNGHAGTDDGIIIAGGGLAAQRCAEALRRGGYDGALRMVCAEPERPYDRPPLSKEALTDPVRDSALPYRSAEWYADNEIDLLLGVAAAGVAPAQHRLSLADGSRLRYRRLLIATGGRPRTVPVLAGYDNVSVLRTLHDARMLREVLASRPRLAVVGAGFIGLEIAATARRLGIEVTIIEAAPCPLAGILGPELGGWFHRLHAAEGADVRCAVTVDRVESAGAVRALVLSDGTTVETDHVVVGVGIAPEIEWLEGTALHDRGGIPVDVHGRTAIDDVFAAGDAAATFDASSGRHLPGSHWEAAGRQGARVARLMLGQDPGPAPLTSFWTDQYGLRIQYVGRRGAAETVEFDGDPESRNFTAIFSHAGAAVAALLVDRPRSLPAARQLIEKGRP